MSIRNLTAKKLRLLLDYNSATGLFIWKVDRRVVKAGDLAGCLRPDGYVDVCVSGVRYMAHRLAWFYVKGRWPREDTDHINGCRFDNRFANLRSVTRTVNLQNKRTHQTNNKCGFFGVDKLPSGRFRARIKGNYPQRNIGTFATAELAHGAYLSIKRKIHRGCTI